MVSIGIPVYNGAVYLRDALVSVLAQTFPNLELIISDNASNDGTEDICQEYLGRDKRITYIRHATNLGAGPNYDNCFHKSSGKYFKWLAHDDMIASSFIEKSVDALEASPDAVLCYSHIREIDMHNKTIREYDPGFSGLSADSPSQRFKPLIKDMTDCKFFFGLFRRNVLINSELHGNYISSDKILIAETGLRGRFVKIDEPLILIREHNQRYTRAIYPNRNRSLVWLDTASNKRKPYRRLTLYKKYIHIINKNIFDRKERMFCYKYLIEYAFRKRNLKILMHDLIMAISSGLYRKIGFINTADKKLR